MPVTASVYLAYHASGQLLYVGLSLGPLARFSQHSREAEWWLLVHRIEIERYDTRQEARTRELHLIRTERPPFNKQDNPRRPPTRRIGRTPGLSPTLDLLAAAVRKRDQAKEKLADTVHAARQFGCTWKEIGTALGVTYQAAWERYGPKVEE